MRKRRVSMLLVLCMVLTLLPTTVFASNIVDSGMCGEALNLTWTLDSEGLLTISGAGNIDGWRNTWDPDAVRSVVINSGITSIGDEAFSEHYNLESIMIPDSVMSIGINAFEYAYALKSIQIPASVESIGLTAFFDCRALTDIVVENGNNIYCSDNGIVYSNDKKTLVCYPAGKSEKVFAIPSTVKSIGDGAFAASKNLTSVSIPNNVTSIGAMAFYACEGLKRIEIPDSVSIIQPSTFDYCINLTSVTLPDCLVTIGEGAFSSCESLKNIAIPNSVTSLGDYAFSECSFESITIPDSVVDLGTGLFSSCPNLKNVKFSANVTSIAKYMFHLCKSLETFIIPDHITSIGSSAFESCTNLNKITIPDGVKSIGSRAFTNCSSLTSIAIPNGITNIQYATFERCVSLIDVALPDSVTSIGHDAFYGCTSLKDIKIPNGVTEIQGSTFENCTNLMSIIIPDGVTKIRGYAFEGCTGLTVVSLPASLSDIGYAAFNKCSGLMDIYFDGTEEQWNSTLLHKGVYNDSLDYAMVHCKYVPSQSQEIEIEPTLNFTRGPSCHVDYKRQLAIMAVTNDAAWYDDGDITWTSSNEKAVKIKQTYVFTDGITYIMAMVEGVGDGVSTITLKTSDGRKTSCVVTSGGNDTKIIPVQSISLSGAFQLSVGETTKISATVSPSNATNKYLEWSSSDPKVATVNSAGYVTGVDSGFVVISAMASSGVSEDYGIEVLSAKDRLERGYQFSDYRYSFFNNRDAFGYSSDYKIPLERYLQAGITEPKARVLSLGKWGGSCFGMSMSSALFAGGALQAKNYTDVQAIAQINVPWYLSAPSSDSRGDSKLRQMIELFQVSQRRADFKDISFSVNKIVSELDAGNPVLLNLHDGHIQHTVVLYGYEKAGQTYSFGVYDCSGFVNKLNYISDSNYSFEYSDDSYHWKIDSYDSLYSLDQIFQRIKQSNIKGASTLLKVRKKVNESSTEKETCIIVNAENIRISDLSGNNAELSNGEWIGNIAARVIRSDNLLSESTYSLMIKRNSYSIIGPGRFSAADDWMGIDVTVPEDTSVTISEDLHSISIDCAEGDDFSVNYMTFDNLFDDLTITGTATGPVEVSLAEDNQSAEVTGASALKAKATVSESATEVSSEAITADSVVVFSEERSDGVTLQLRTEDEALTETSASVERQQTESPDYDLESGTYDAGQTLIFTKDDDTLIYYTLDGTEPTEETGLLYTLPIDITHSVTVKAIAIKYGYTPSENVSLEYLLPVLYAPTTNVLPGSYNKVQYVDLEAEEGAEVYYTLDGSDPKEYGEHFGSGIVLENNTTIKAYAVKDGLISDVITYDYEIDPKPEKLAIVEHPEDRIADVSDIALFIVVAQGDGLSYQWQYRQPGKMTWYDSSMPGSTTDTLQVTATAKRDGQSYRCVITDANGETVTSDAATLTITTPQTQLAITSQPQNVPGFIGETVQIAVAAQGEGLTYQWQYQRAGSVYWYASTFPGADTDTLSIPVMASRDGQRYRCVVTDASGANVVSDTAVLTVISPLAIQRQPENASGNIGTTVSFSVGVQGDGLSYQWQYQKAGKAYWYASTLNGADTDTLSVPVTTARDGQNYRCVITDASGNSVTSEPAQLAVKSQTEQIVITTQPKDVTAASGTTAILTVEAQGEGLTYRWQYQKPGKTSWFDSSFTGSDTDRLEIPATLARDGQAYRCVITDRNGNSITTEKAILTISNLRQVQ